MPELPEVETTRRGISPWCIDRQITAVTVWQSALRWPVPAHLDSAILHTRISQIERRGKYLVIHCGNQRLLVHLGMSGNLRITTPDKTRRKHDHWQILLDGELALRYHDPRRFGLLLLSDAGNLATHPLLVNQGVEPLSKAFNADYLYSKSRGRSLAVKNFIMDGHVLLGVGNIYAAEALYLAGIHPRRGAGRISLQRYEKLVGAIRTVLEAAIESGGTTLRDYVDGSGNPGYFRQQLQVYGKAGEPCRQCGRPIRSIRLGQRSSFYCSRCQI